MFGGFRIPRGGSDFDVSRILDARFRTDFILGKGNAAIFLGMERFIKTETPWGK
jgi:hypothetical protein